ncbi:hypothetical protein WJX72_002161 [[Myrmecia] bisecta]|uniref:Uncharacterized protein n=1 Tax=[Myrmecia] bisecta TaxID=41462 RepID=A0AAW1QED4_9CHLO
MSLRPAGNTDQQRIYLKALELLSSDAPDSQQQLLGLVRKCKQDSSASQRATGSLAAGFQGIVGAHSQVKQKFGTDPSQAPGHNAPPPLNRTLSKNRPPARKKSKLDGLLG